MTDCICGRNARPHTRQCNGHQTAVGFARDMADEDAGLLREVAAGLTSQRLATRLNVSRQAATNRINRARSRQRLLQPTG